MNGVMKMDFGTFIKGKRIEKGIALRELADKLKITPSYLSDIEKGRRYAPDKDKILEISSILGIVDEEELSQMFDLAGQSKAKDAVAPDLPEFINENEKIRVLLRKAKKANPSPETLDKMIKMLEEE